MKKAVILVSDFYERKKVSVVFHKIMLSCEMQSVPHANGRKLVMWPETDVGSELPLTSFHVTHPGLGAVKVDMF